AIATNASIAPARVLHLGISLAAPFTSSEPVATLRVGITGANAPQAVDTDTLVLLRGGFEDPYVPLPLGTWDCAGLDAQSTVAVTLPDLPGATPFDTLWRVRADDGRTLALQRANLGPAPWLRLTPPSAGGGEHGSRRAPRARR